MRSLPGIALLKQYRDATLKEDGNLRAEALAEIERPNRFVVVEVWRDKAALDAHGQSAATLKLRDKLKPIADAPYDERINNALYVTEVRTRASPARFFTWLPMSTSFPPARTTAWRRSRR